MGKSVEKYRVFNSHVIGQDITIGTCMQVDLLGGKKIEGTHFTCKSGKADTSPILNKCLFYFEKILYKRKFIINGKHVATEGTKNRQTTKIVWNTLHSASLGVAQVTSRGFFFFFLFWV